MRFRTADPTVEIIFIDPEEALRHAQAEAIKARIEKARAERAAEATRADCVTHGGHVYAPDDLRMSFGSTAPFGCLVCGAFRTYTWSWNEDAFEPKKPARKKKPA